jgi:hypothetical protein
LDRCYVRWESSNRVSGIHVSLLTSVEDELEKIQQENGTWEEPSMFDGIIIT